MYELISPWKVLISSSFTMRCGICHNLIEKSEVFATTKFDGYVHQNCWIKETKENKEIKENNS